MCIYTASPIYKFRASKEHSQLKTSNYEKGVFPKGHEWEGEEYWVTTLYSS